jgi:hypothetical protein
VKEKKIDPPFAGDERINDSDEEFHKNAIEGVEVDSVERPKRGLTCCVIHHYFVCGMLRREGRRCFDVTKE